MHWQVDKDGFHESRASATAQHDVDNAVTVAFWNAFT